jgi:hypothetical protein
VSSSSHNSSYGAQDTVSSQSRQRHLLHLPGLVLVLVEDTHSHSRLRDRGEQQLRRSWSVSSRLMSLRFPEVHGQRLSVFTSATCETCPGRRFGGWGVCQRIIGFLVGVRSVTPGSRLSCWRASTPLMCTVVHSSVSTECFNS